MNRAFLLPWLLVNEEVAGYFGLRDENVRLRADLERRSLEVAELEWIRVENLKLREALGFRGRQPAQLLAAEVIASSGERFPRSFVINKGSRDGVRPNQPVVTPDGLVGKTAETDPNAALVLTVRHPDFRASALALAGEDAETGIAAARADGEVELIVPLRSAAKPGDRVITSGIGPVFPRGIPIGRITDIHQEDRLKLQKNDPLLLAVDLNRITSVFVLQPGTPAERSPAAGESALFWPGWVPPAALAAEGGGADSLAAAGARDATP
ncbi:MAG: rod shape-determining protein MreC [Gemmatimonadota bacterium]